MLANAEHEITWYLNKNKNKPNEPIASVPQKDFIILLPYIGLHRNHITKRLKSCVNRFYCSVRVNVRVIFQNTQRIKSFFPYNDRFSRSQLSKVIYKASCWGCKDFYIGKTKRRLHDRKTEHFKAQWVFVLDQWVFVLDRGFKPAGFRSSFLGLRFRQILGTIMFFSFQKWLRWDGCRSRWDGLIRR